MVDWKGGSRHSKRDSRVSQVLTVDWDGKCREMCLEWGSHCLQVTLSRKHGRGQGRREQVIAGDPASVECAWCWDV